MMSEERRVILNLLMAVIRRKYIFSSADDTEENGTE